MHTFHDRVAVITGGASGIGRGMAERFARERMKIVLADVEQPAVEFAAAEMRAAGADVIGIRCDVSAYNEVETLANQVFERFPAVHILANNAGVAPNAVPTWALTQADWSWVLGVNLGGVINGVRAFVPRMIKGGDEGHIVNTASLAGLVPGPFNAPYSVSKFGIVALTESVYYELALTGSKLKTSVLCPAWVRTQIIDSARNRPPTLADATPSQIDENVKEAFRARINEGMTPAAVADMVFEAIRNEQLYIWTHPEYKPMVEARMKDVIEGRNPDIEKMIAGIREEAAKRAAGPPKP